MQVLYSPLCSTMEKNVSFVSVLWQFLRLLFILFLPFGFSSRWPDTSAYLNDLYTRFRRRQGGEKRVTFSRRVFCERGTTDCLIVRSIFAAFPVEIDSKKRSSSYFIRFHHGIPLASVNLVGGYRFHLSIFSFLWIAPCLQLSVEDRILAGIRSTLLRRKYWKSVVLVAFPIHFLSSCTQRFT